MIRWPKGRWIPVSELEALHKVAQPDGHYFDRATLKWFGSHYRKARELDDVIVYSEKQRPWSDTIPPWRALVFTKDGIPTDATATGWSRIEAMTAALESQP